MGADVGGVNDRRPPGTTYLEELTHSSSGRPRGRRTCFVQEEVNPQLARIWIEPARREVTPRFFIASVREEQLDVIVKSQRGEAREIVPRKHNTKHAGRKPLNAPH